METVTVYALVDGPLGEKVEEWLQMRQDVAIQATLSDEDGLSEIHADNPDLIISAGYRYIISEDILSVPDRGAVNLHYSYLPFNRGANTNVWSIIDDHPAGVSIHYMVPEVDSGPLIERKQIPIYPDDNGRDLYNRLIDEQFALFKENWLAIRDERVQTHPNPTEEGTHHYSSEFEELCELDRSETTTVGKVIDRLRALTFPPYKNAYFVEDGDKYYVDIKITPESELDE